MFIRERGDTGIVCKFLKKTYVINYPLFIYHREKRVKWLSWTMYVHIKKKKKPSKIEIETFTQSTNCINFMKATFWQVCFSIAFPMYLDTENGFQACATYTRN